MEPHPILSGKASTPRPASRSSQISGHGLELPERGPALCPWCLERAVEAVTDVVVNQRFLGVLDRAFDRLQLLRDLQAGPTHSRKRVDHERRRHVEPAGENVVALDIVLLLKLRICSWRAGTTAADAALLVGVLKGRRRLRRVVGGAGKNQRVADQLET
jgi:hypothetical protein